MKVLIDNKSYISLTNHPIAHERASILKDSLSKELSQ